MERKMIYLCATKVLGFFFAVETKEQAERFVKADPYMHYFSEIIFFDKNDPEANL